MFKNICRSHTNNLIRTTIIGNVEHLIGSNSSLCISTTAPLTHHINSQIQINLNHPQIKSIRVRNMSTDDVKTGEMPSTSAFEVKRHIFTNRLAQEKSPYLLQHAHNPVDWYPWGEEAIERAKRENKLIFLSVGYSTCHWCHVMEYESFENEAVADIMNRNFVNIKVDREERPDIDRIYMQFVLMMNGSGGWPMSVWLTPDLAPITAGTYFPPTDRWGMPSFTNVLTTIADKWAKNQDELIATGLEVIEVLQRTLNEKTSEAIFEEGSSEAKVAETLRIFEIRFDHEYGGFGSHPKFPKVPRLNFLFHAHVASKQKIALDMALETLRFIGKGGIHDHIFGGFARYSVDRKWHVPHFEKMVYDQGQLMAVYADAYKLTRENTFLDYADGIYNYLIEDLRHPRGGFYAGEDADSLPSANTTKKVEGAFYGWTFNEVKQCIIDNKEKLADCQGGDVEQIINIYTHHYALNERGNVEPSSDPHGHLTGKNILIVEGSIEKTCEKFALEEQNLKRLLTLVNKMLYEKRKERPRPHLDTKIICSWNGLILIGLSKLADCGTERRNEYLSTAARLKEFLYSNLYDKESKTLQRSCYGLGTKDDTILQHVEKERIEGFLDDYSFLIKGLLDFYKTSLDGTALKWAKELQETQDSLFWDNDHGAYFYSQANSPNVVVRLKDDHDGAEPSGNSMAAYNLLLLAQYYNDENYSKRVIRMYEFFADQKPFGYVLPEMLSTMMLQDNGLDLVAVGPKTDLTQKFAEICRKYYIPGMLIAVIDPQEPVMHVYNQCILDKYKMIDAQPTVYLCHGGVCRMPITDPVKLEEELSQIFLRISNDQPR
uniref:Spermatogenesis-associated protein 20-like TRX domain-containing protein n=1 Tax=Glossina brevipalpis TaxID=37001 RepID=A0A1A9WYV4_9MUSC